MKKLFVFTSSIIFVIQVFAQTQVIHVDQVLENDSKLKSTSPKQSKQVPGHFNINKELGLTADQFINGKKPTLCETPQSDLRKTATLQSKKGRTHYRYQQTWNGIPIEGHHLLVHEENGTLQSINGAMVTGLSVNTNPGLSEAQALAKARQLNTKYAWENAAMERELQIVKGDPGATYFPKGKLIIFSDDLPSVTQQAGQSQPSSNFKLAWQFKLFSLKPFNHQKVYVDAHTGNVLHTTSLMKHTYVQGTGSTNYNGNQSFTCKHNHQHYELENTDIETRKFTGSYFGIGQSTTNLDTSWNGKEAALDVHWGQKSLQSSYAKN